MLKRKKDKDDALAIIKKRYSSKNQAQELEAERLNLDIAHKIYKLRNQAGLSQRQLAKLVGSSPAAICRLENADYEGHSIRMLRKVAEALNARVEIKFVSIKTRLMFLKKFLV